MQQTGKMEEPHMDFPLMTIPLIFLEGLKIKKSVRFFSGT